MTMNKVFSKLRSSNRKNYVQFIFCITLSIVLVTSYAVMLFSPVIQDTLPIGGDSRTQVTMIFILAVIGCLVFAIYAAGLFFRYKSRETGVFLALGAKKKQLKKALYVEIITIVSGCIAAGLVIGSAVAFLIWQMFRGVLINGKDMPFVFRFGGYGIGLLFSTVVAICILIMAARYMKRTNLMDVLNEHRKSEKVREVSRGYGILAVVLLVSGIALGYGGPLVTASFGIRMPSAWSVVYLLSIVGIYMLLLFALTYHQKGKYPQTYYNRIVPFSMMKFQGRQSVRNMLIIAILIVCGLFASFNPTQLYTGVLRYRESPTDYAIPYPKTAGIFADDEIWQLAEEYGVQIKDYQEYEFAELLGSGVERDWTDDGAFITIPHEEYMYYDIVSQSQNESMSGEQITVSDDGYYRVINPGDSETMWVVFDDLDLVTNPVTGQKKDLTYEGVLEYRPLVTNGKIRYVVSDRTLEELSAGLTDENLTKQILFNVEDVEGSYEFASALYERILERAPVEMAVMETYDKKQEEIALAEGTEYGYNEPMEMSPKNTDLMEYWKYYPAMKVLAEKSYFQNFAVFFLLFIYVSVICLAAVGVVAYTRSITIGINNRQLFEDLVRLGAKKRYVRGCIKSQLSKIFFLPGLIGCTLMMLFTVMMFWFNDSQLSAGELWAIRADLVVVLAVAIYLYAVYRASFKKIETMIKMG